MRRALSLEDSDPEQECDGFGVGRRLIWGRERGRWHDGRRYSAVEAMVDDRGAGRAAAPSSRTGRPPMEISTRESEIDEAGGRGTDGGSAADEGPGGGLGRHLDVPQPQLPLEISLPDTAIRAGSHAGGQFDGD